MPLLERLWKPAGLLAAAALAGLAALALTACTPSRPALANAFDSPEDTARAVLDALAARDIDRLLDLALDEHEFRRIVWPALPSSRPAAGVPVEYAWGRLHLNSRARLSLTLAEHGGRRYELSAIRFRGATRYGPFTVHRDTELMLREPDGPAQPVRLFGSLLDCHGRWKVFSYVVD